MSKVLRVIAASDVEVRETLKGNGEEGEGQEEGTWATRA